MPHHIESFHIDEDNIDSQHRQLIALGSRVSEFTNLTLREAHGEYHTILNDLATLLGKHFEYEEGLLERNQSPNLSAHRGEHLRLQEQLADLLCSSMMAGADCQALSTMLEDYVIEHMTKWDLADKAYLQQ
ncbi:MAG: hemerythrin family protein [Proteobacteria bacterium]|nr:hemerythrin family protein [Pseudomonadota bacterium]